MLTQVFKPGLHKKGLHHAPFDGGVLEYAPGIGAITPPLTPQIFKRGEKCLSILRVDPIFDGYQHRPAIRLDLMSDDWLRPMHRRCQVEPCSGLELPPPGQRYCQEGAGRSHEVCG